MHVPTHVLAVVIAGSLFLGCADDASKTEARPTAEDLEELFVHLCTLNDECETGSWPTLQKCVDDQFGAYGTRSTSCLVDVVDYYECAIEVGEQTCGWWAHRVAVECNDHWWAALDSWPPDIGF